MSFDMSTLLDLQLRIWWLRWKLAIRLREIIAQDTFKVMESLKLLRTFLDKLEPLVNFLR